MSSKGSVRGGGTSQRGGDLGNLDLEGGESPGHCANWAKGHSWAKEPSGTEGTYLSTSHGWTWAGHRGAHDSCLLRADQPGSPKSYAAAEAGGKPCHVARPPALFLPARHGATKGSK
jgi:hypothetical protein